MADTRYIMNIKANEFEADVRLRKGFWGFFAFRLLKMDSIEN